jgi:hypothetical protein
LPVGGVAGVTVGDLEVGAGEPLVITAKGLRRGCFDLADAADIDETNSQFLSGVWWATTASSSQAYRGAPPKPKGVARYVGLYLHLSPRQRRKKKTRH